MPVLDAFRIKEFDLDPIYASWPDAPRFSGNFKKDPPVDDWLNAIKAGCVERKVPKEYWHRVGQNYMGERASARLDELKAVLRNMHGGKYRWDWKKFKVAMRNMGWEIDPKQTEEVKVQSRPSGIWWILTGKEKQDLDDLVLIEKPAADATEMNGKVARKVSEKTKASTGIAQEVDKVPAEKPSRKRTLRMSSISEEKSLPAQTGEERSDKSDSSKLATGTKTMTAWLSRTMSTKSSASIESSNGSVKSDRSSDTSHSSRTSSTSSSTASTPTQTPGDITTAVAHAPVWLLNACNALDFLNTEHPKTMSAVSAILITIGTLPSIPAISAGAGGALLASHAVQAVGAIAVGVGNWIKQAQDATATRNAENQANNQQIGSSISR